MTACGAVFLAACGSSGSGSSTGASGTNASATNASLSDGSTGCKEVPQPASHAGKHASRPNEHLDAAHTYKVTLSTNCGEIVIQLAAKEAPVTASSFASLVHQGFYDGLTFHRIVPHFVIQGGDPNGNGTGGPGYTVVEPPPARLQYTRGVVAMAKSGGDPSGTSGSQFFIVTAANAGLPPQYALVGNVVSGEGVVEAIEKVPTVAGPDGEESAPGNPVVIEKATLAVT
jgi:cyclophilin family peptidyl-prolyl cis-trans isomerase